MEIPNIGLGFWQIKKEDVKRVLFAGLEAGYRHIDTAIAYDNEGEIGDALSECGQKREELFLTSKVPAEIKTYEGAKRAIDESIARLKCGYLDLMLIHAPKPWALMNLPSPRFRKGNLAVWKALSEAKAEGKVRQIGVSNFSVSDIENLLEHSGEKPFANQIRVHVGHVDAKTMAFCREKGILIEAYSPSGTGRLLKNGTVVSLAQKYGVSPAQLCIRYDLELGTIPLPRSKNPAHIAENIKVDFAISEEDRKQLDKVFAF